MTEAFSSGFSGLWVFEFREDGRVYQLRPEDGAGFRDSGFGFRG